jgi:hypothetical protein
VRPTDHAHRRDASGKKCGASVARPLDAQSSSDSSAASTSGSP